MQTVRTPRTIRSWAACVVAASALAGCGDDVPQQPVLAPLDVSGPSDGQPPTTHSPAVSPSAPVPPTSAGPDAGADDLVPARTLATVSEALGRYGAVLGELSADPEGAPAPGTAGRDRWDAVVLAGSPLSAELLDRINRRAIDDRVVVDPDPDGVSFRHVPVGVDAAGPTTIEFRWCGWSPGIGRSLDSGEVVDDAVAHSTGTGSLVLVEGTWRVAALDQYDLELLPPGSADPCPTATGEERP